MLSPLPPSRLSFPLLPFSKSFFSRRQADQDPIRRTTDHRPGLPPGGNEIVGAVAEQLVKFGATSNHIIAASSIDHIRCPATEEVIRAVTSIENVEGSPA